VPRVECARDGVSQAATPWTDPGSRFTAFLEAVVIDWPNGASESPNARIQRIKRMACGYRNRERFGNAIPFRLPRLDLPPRPVSTHTIA
jgi:transposase